MTGADQRREGVRQGATRKVHGKTHPRIGEQEVREEKRKKMGQKLVQAETFLGTRNYKREGSCHDLELNPQLSPAFIGLLNNLRDYNNTKSIDRTGQVTILHKQCRTF